MLTKMDIFLPSRFSTRPTMVPTIRVAGTTTSANSTVVRSESQNSGSAKMLVKFAKPIHCVGSTPLACWIP